MTECFFCFLIATIISDFLCTDHMWQESKVRTERGRYVEFFQSLHQSAVSF